MPQVQLLYLSSLYSGLSCSETEEGQKRAQPSFIHFLLGSLDSFFEDTRKRSERRAAHHKTMHRQMPTVVIRAEQCILADGEFMDAIGEFASLWLSPPVPIPVER